MRVRWAIVIFLMTIWGTGCWAGAVVGILEIDSSDKADKILLLPTAFSLVNPPDVWDPVSTDITFTWEDADNEDQYLLQISTSTTFGVLVYQSPNLTNDVTNHAVPGGVLSVGTTYYWRVWATNGDGTVVAENGPFSFTPTQPSAWAQTIGGTNEEWLHSLWPMPGGGYLFSGTSNSFIGGQSQGWIVRLGNDATINWSRQYGIGSIVVDLVPLSGGGFATIANTQEPVILVLDSEGNIQWQKKYTSPTFLSASVIQATSDGGYALGGIYDNPAIKGWIIKTSSNGTIQWQRSYQSNGAGTWFSDVKHTQDGGFVGAGTAQGEALVIKTNSAGTVLWAKQFSANPGDNEGLLSIMEASDGSFVAVGTHNGSGITGQTMVKLNSNGTLAWQKVWGVSIFSGNSSITETSDGGFVMVAIDFTSGIDFWGLKVDAAGNEIWQFKYDSGANDYPEVVIEDADGGILFGGRSLVLGAGDYDAWVLKANPDGTLPPISTATVYPSGASGYTSSNPTISTATTSATAEDSFIATNTNMIVNQQEP